MGRRSYSWRFKGEVMTEDEPIADYEELEKCNFPVAAMAPTYEDDCGEPAVMRVWWEHYEQAMLLCHKHYRKVQETEPHLPNIDSDENARLREQVRVLAEALKHEEPRDYIDTEDMVLMQVQAIRRKQRANYSAQHDRQHEPWEWLGLIATYAAAARFADAAALCVAAALAAVKEEKA